MLQMASHRSLITASSDGKWPRFLMILRSWLIQGFDAVGIRYEMTQEVRVNVLLAWRLVLGIRCDRPEQGPSGEHVWAGRSCSLGCEPVLVVGRPCDWSGCAVSAYP
jgi:hypothetical protein